MDQDKLIRSILEPATWGTTQEAEIQQRLALLSENEAFKPIFPDGSHILHQASRCHHVNLLLALKNRFGDLKKHMIQDRYGYTPLHEPCYFHRSLRMLEFVRHLLPFCSLKTHQSKDCGFTAWKGFMHFPEVPSCVEAARLIDADYQIKRQEKQNLALLATAMVAERPAPGVSAKTALQRATLNSLFDRNVLRLVRSFLNF